MSDAAVPAPSLPPPRKKNNWGWIGFFVFIVAASLAAAGTMIWYNLSIQLKPEQLEAARRLWKERGPRDYKMLYTTRLNDSDRTDTFLVTVRGGEVREVLMNGRPLDAEQRPYYSMDAIFNQIEKFMRIDQKPGAPKVYVTAVFDEDTGAMRKYVRRVMGSSQRVEMTAKIEPLGK
jgi:hypothetical protein